MLKITEIKREDMPVSHWSGGKTTEIKLFPDGAAYADRDFLFRISTAEVELESSDFTSLPDYERLIASVDGELRLSVGGAEGVVIRPRETVHRFDGGAATHCEGRARDLNLMLRKGAAEGELRFVKAGERVVLALAPNEFALVYALESGAVRFAETDEEDFLVFMADEESALFTVKLV